VNLAFCKTQIEYLNCYMALHGRKPSTGQFLSWEKEVAKESAKLKSEKENRQMRKALAIEEWNLSSTEERIDVLSELVQYKLSNDAEPDPVLDAIYSEVMKDTAYSRLVNYLLGNAQANSDAIAEGVEVNDVRTPNRFKDGFTRRGFIAAKKGLKLSLDEQVAYITKPSTVRL